MNPYFSNCSSLHRLSRSLAQMVKLEHSPKERVAQADNEEQAPDALIREPIDPERVWPIFTSLSVNRSTMKISGVKLPKMRLLLTMRYPP